MGRAMFFTSTDFAEPIMKSIKFYHCIFCPRCALTRLHLKSLRKEFPEIEIDLIEVLSNRKRMKEDGVAGFPTLKYANKSLTGFLLTRSAIRSYLTEI